MRFALEDIAGSVAQIAPDATSASAGAGELVRMVLSLGLVVVTILAIGWISRRMQARAHSGAGNLRVVESLAVGIKERVLVLEVGARQIVVGSSPAGLRTLLVLDEALPTRAAGATPTRGFGELLAQWRKPS